MRVEDVRNVVIVGSGTMGRQIGLQCAIHGHKVVIYDIAPDVLEMATAQIKEYAAQMVVGGRLTQEEAEASLAKITPTNDPERAGAGADVLSESVPENPELKCKVFAQFNELCPAHAIFTTNTSTLLPSMFAAATGRPTQFAAFHFHPYVWESNVVEIMPHPGTSKTVVRLLRTFAKRIGQIPIVLAKESQSYVFNSMMNALNSTALALVSEGVASVEEIDRAWMGVTKMPMGPFGNLDFVGLDVVWHVTQYWAKVLGNPRIQANANFLKTYVDKGHLGVKSGRGF